MQKADRAQRMFVGLALMAINLSLVNFDDLKWQNIASLAIQAELILTAVFGWCPFYYSLAFFGKKST